MTPLVVTTNAADLDRLLVPSAIYTETLAYNTTFLTTYFENNPQVMLSFVGLNTALKRANQLNYEKKCGCLYTTPWTTQYNVENSGTSATLNFSQQVELYQYMIRNWYGSNPTSYLRYLSQIALSILLKLKQTKYYIDNNLGVCASPYTSRTFTNNYEFLKYLRDNNIVV